MTEYKRPSEALNAIMAGELHPQDAPQPVQSWLTLRCFQIATQLQAMPARQQKAAAAEYPSAVVDIIREQYKKLRR